MRKMQIRKQTISKEEQERLIQGLYQKTVSLPKVEKPKIKKPKAEKPKAEKPKAKKAKVEKPTKK